MPDDLVETFGVRNRLAHALEQIAGRLYVRAFKLRIRAGNDHECAHILAAITWGNSEGCNRATCQALTEYRREAAKRHA